MPNDLTNRLTKARKSRAFLLPFRVFELLIRLRQYLNQIARGQMLRRAFGQNRLDQCLEPRPSISFLFWLARFQVVTSLKNRFQFRLTRPGESA